MANHHVHQKLAQLLQDQISVSVAVMVVKILEVIQVDHGNAQVLPKVIGEILTQGHPVGQTCQLISLAP